jgi:hypothetical protein
MGITDNKNKMKNMKITRFMPDVPCNGQDWKYQLGCNHTACRLWTYGWRVHLWKFWFIKFLVWERN